MHTTKNWSLALLALLAASRAAQAQVIIANPAIAQIATGPKSPGVTGYDTRYFKPGAGAAYRNCVQNLTVTQPGTGTGPQQLTIPLSMAENSCLSSVAAAYASNLCITPARAECRSMDYYASWCGRREYTARNADAAWLCHAELRSALLSLPAGSLRTLAIPSEMSAASGTERHYLERAQGYFYEPPVSAYFEFDSFSPSSLRPLPSSDSVSVPPRPGTIVPGGPGGGPGIGTVVFSTINPMLAWNANGAAVASCDEYAYEKYYDLAVFYDQAKAQLRRPRETINALLAGNFVTLTPVGNTAAWNMRDKSGVAVGNPFPAPLRYPMTETATPITVKNAYYEIARRMSPAYNGLSPTHTPSLQWNFDQNRRAQQAGYLDVEMEELKLRQAELWPIYDSWSVNESTANAYTSWAAGCQRLPGASICNHYPGPDAATRAAARVRADQLRIELDAGLEFGRLHGCIPADAATMTPCDWAPSSLSTRLLERLPGQQATAAKTCREQLGNTAVDNTALYTSLRNFLRAPVPAAWASIRVEQYTNQGWVSAASPGTPRVYTTSTAMLERFFSDKRDFLRALYNALTNSGGTRGALSRSGKYEKTMGRDGFGVAFSNLSLADADPYGGATICDSTSEYASKTQVDVNMMGNYDLLDADFDLATALPPSLVELGRAYDGCNGDPGCSSFDGTIPLRHSFAVGNNLIYVPGELIGNTLSATYNPKFSARITLFNAPWSSPPFTASLRAGIGFSLGGRGTLSATFLERLSGASTCTPGETRLAVSAGPFASAGGWVAAGVGVGLPVIKIEAGIRGSLDVIDFSIMGTGEHVIRRFAGNPDPEVSDNLSLDLRAEFLSGTISLFLDVSILFIDITIFEVVLARFVGPSINWRILSSDGITGARICALTHIEGLFQTVQRTAPSGCVIP